MKAKELLAKMTYIGQAVGLRQTYDVFQGKRTYIVVSFSRSKRRSGNFNIVDSDAVQDTQHSFAGQHGVTSKDVKKRLRRKGYTTEALEALNILYVLVAMKAARIDRRLSQRELFFDLGPSS